MDIISSDNIEIVDNKKEVALERAGVTRSVMYSVLYKGLHAKKKVKIINDVGEEEVFEEDDLVTAHKYLDTALRVVGDLKGDAMIDNRKVSITTNVDPVDLEQRIKAVMDKRNAD